MFSKVAFFMSGTFPQKLGNEKKSSSLILIFIQKLNNDKMQNFEVN